MAEVNAKAIENPFSLTSRKNIITLVAVLFFAVTMTALLQLGRAGGATAIASAHDSANCTNANGTTVTETDNSSKNGAPVCQMSPSSGQPIDRYRPTTYRYNKTSGDWEDLLGYLKQAGYREAETCIFLKGLSGNTTVDIHALGYTNDDRRNVSIDTDQYSEYCIISSITTNDDQNAGFTPLTGSVRVSSILVRGLGESDDPVLQTQVCRNGQEITINEDDRRSTDTNPPCEDVPSPDGYDDNLELIKNNSSTVEMINDNTSPFENYRQDQLRINDFVIGNHAVADRSSGIWHSSCNVSHFAYDDPIVFPNNPGRAHLHMFFGNTDANAYSDSNTLYNNGSSTCARDELNRTSYWVPALLDGNNEVLPADQITIYYAVRNKTVASRTEAFPEGLRMIAGDPSKTSQAQAMRWNCGFFGAAIDNPKSGSAGPESTTIPNCDKSKYSHLHMSIKFPRCWNGRDLDSADHRSHMAYSEANGDASSTCPSSHPVELPQIRYRIHFNLSEVSSTPSGDWYLSSDVDSNGNIKSNGGSIHGDWWGGWNPELNQILVNNCIKNQYKNCQEDDIGDGRYTNYPSRRYKGPGINVREFTDLCPSESTPSNTRDVALCKTR